MSTGSQAVTQPGAYPFADAEVAAMLESTVERILADLCTPAMLRAAERGDADAVAPLWSALESAGLVDALRSPDDGLGWPELRPVIEACGRWGVPAPLAETLAAQALARLAEGELAEGGASIGIGRSQGDTVVVEGVAFASIAFRIVCSLEDESGGSASLWVFERGDARIERRPNGCGEERGALSFDRGRGRQVGVLPAGIGVLHAGAAIRAAQIAGACERVLTLSTQYSGDRVQFGRPIGKFQAIQQQLALAAEWSAMASMASQLAFSGPGVALDAARVAAAKQVAGSAAQLCAEIGHAVHGAIGATAEYDLQLYTRRLWSWAGEFGSSLYWARTLGAALVAEGDAQSWDSVVRASAP